MTKTDAKFNFWLLRVHTTFDGRVAAAVAKGKAPNLRNSAYMYRDELPELVMRSAFLMVTYDAEFRHAFSAREYEALKAEYLRGARDADLLSSCRVMDKGFKVADLRFMQLAQCAEATASLADESQLDSAQSAALLADFNLFWETLKVEQSVRALSGCV